MERYFDVLRLAHDAVGRMLRDLAEARGDGLCAVDATVGNGHDTLFLAQAVGPRGRVYGFDVQERAIKATQNCCGEAGVGDRVTLLHAGHERMAELLPDDVTAAAVMFNLGYLPGADKSVVTQPATTIAALDAALSLLAPGGVISITAYTAHPGGSEETEAVRHWCAGLNHPLFKAMEYGMANCPEAKRLFLVGRFHG